MKKFKYIFIMFTLTFCMLSCNDWLDVNVDPDSPAAVDAEQILPVVMFYAAQANYDHAEYGVYLSQCLTTGGKNPSGSLPYKAGWHFLGINRHPQWRRHYFDIGKNALEMDKAAEQSGQHDYLALSRTIMLLSTQLTTDAFGDMPRTEAYSSSSPAYDTQESIYEWMLEEADALLREYDNPDIYNVSKPITSKQDRVFGGDMSKWKQVVYAIKARILLRNIPKMNNNVAMCDQIIAAAQSALNGWSEPLYYYDGGNVDEQNCPWSSVKPIINSWESRRNDLDEAIPSKFFMEQMLKYDSETDTASDPRLPYLMKSMPNKATGEVKYRYLENNYGKPASLDYIEYPDLYENTLAQTTSAVSLFPTAELYFIIAEAAYWKNDKTAAVQAMQNGITAHMNRLGLPQQEIQAYLSSGEVPGVSNVTLADIMREKYIAMYLQAEQWTDMRRYNYSNNEQNRFGLSGEEVIIYPTLRRPYNLYTAYWSVSAPNEWVQRLNYDPETEEKYSTNELIRLGAFDPATESGNPDWLKKPMIWSPAYSN